MNKAIPPYVVNSLIGQEIDFPYQSMIVTVPKDTKTRLHSHTESEKWVVTQGQGIVTLDEETRQVKANDVLELPPLVSHCVENTGDEEFKMVALYWADSNLLSQKLVTNKAKRLNSNLRRKLIIPAIVTPNGPMHLGHLSGPFIAADVMRRSLKLEGDKCATFLGTLGHQEHIAVAANKSGESYYELAQRNTRSIKSSFESFAIDHDVFLEPVPTQRYVEILNEIYTTFKQQGLIFEKEVSVFVDVQSGKPLTEAYLVGDCPRCQSKANGHECESCGGLHQDWELKNVTNAITGAAVRPITKKRLFMSLTPFRDLLEKQIKNKKASSQVVTFLESFLAGELPDVPVSHFLSEGVAINDPEFADQKFYISFEHLARYLVAIDGYAKELGFTDYRELMSNEIPDIRIFFGQDNAFSRIVIAPALLCGLLGEQHFPTGIFLNFFLNLEGRKFSTSANHAIWAKDISCNEQVDGLRFYLSSIRSELYETDFSVNQYQMWLTQWQHKLENWFGIVETLMEKETKGFPDPGMLDLTDESLCREHQVIIEEFRLATNSAEFSARKACRLINAYLDMATDYTTNFVHSASSLNDSAHRTRLALVSMLVKGFVLQVSVFMPKYAERIKLCITNNTNSWNWKDSLEPMTKGTIIKGVSRLTQQYFSKSKLSD